MPRCAYCNTSILFRGTRDGRLQYCDELCQQRGAQLSEASEMVGDSFESYLHAVHRGNCPKCGGHGPVNTQLSYVAWSALVITLWRTRVELCCKSCGNRERVFAIFQTLLLGWWGLPWGVLITPVQVCRNIGGMFASPGRRPSKLMRRIVKSGLVKQAVEQEKDAAFMPLEDGRYEWELEEHPDRENTPYVDEV